MSTKEQAAAGGSAEPKKRRYVSQADIPSVTLERAVRVPKTIVENYGSDPTRPIDVASALEMTPSSGGFRTLCGAAVGYGLTEGGPNAPQIALTAVGRRVCAPLENGDDRAALRQAALKPAISARFYDKYDGSALPPENIARNVLASFDVPMDKTTVVYDILVQNAEFVGFTKRIKDKTYIDTGGSVRDADALDAEPGMVEDGDRRLDDAERDSGETGSFTPNISTSNASPPRKNAIFLGHGSNRVPMDQLIKILDEYGIPHKQAVDEANRARPIPVKVAEVMQECGAAILIFTADREYFDREGRSVWRPSENVSHELGAASVLYGDRIVVFKEKGIELPTNFSSIGYIEFDKDKLNEKGIELFRELVSMKIINISVG